MGLADKLEAIAEHRVAKKEAAELEKQQRTARRVLPVVEDGLQLLKDTKGPMFDGLPPEIQAQIAETEQALAELADHTREVIGDDDT